MTPIPAACSTTAPRPREDAADVSRKAEDDPVTVLTRSGMTEKFTNMLIHKRSKPAQRVITASDRARQMPHQHPVDVLRHLQMSPST